MEENRTTIAQVRAVLQEHFQSYGTGMPFFEAVARAFREGGSTDGVLPYVRFLSCEEFWDFVGRMSVIPRTATPRGMAAGGRHHIEEFMIFPDGRDVNIYSHLPHVDDGLHTHDHFELNYVYRGGGRMLFDRRQYALQEGEFLIISPDSPHNIQAEGDEFIISIMVRRSTFQKIFWKLLLDGSVLSAFFRNAVFEGQNNAHILFRTGNDSILQGFVQYLMALSLCADDRSNADMISTLSLIFSILLRRYDHTVSLYHTADPAMHRFDVGQMVSYIYENYDKVSLKDVAEKFHYSESFLSRSIKQAYGRSFSALLREIRLSHATDLLQHSTFSLQEICEMVGYRSVSTFSRTYKEHCGISPSQVRNATNAAGGRYACPDGRNLL